MAEIGGIILKEIRNGLQAAQSKNDILRWLSVTRAVLNPHDLHVDPAKLLEFGYGFSVIQSVKKSDLQAHWKRILEILMSKFSVEWMSTVTPENFNTCVKPLFFEGPKRETFLVLLKAVTEPKRKDFGFHKCVLLLEEFLTQGRLTELLEEQCNESGESNTPQILDMQGEMLVSCLASLPDKMANVLQHENSDRFLPQNYIPTLAMSVLDTCQRAHSFVSQGQSVSLVTVSTLVGKLCLTGRADLLLDTLLPSLCIKVRSDFIWCRICERVFTGVPTRSLEAVVTPLLKRIPWFGLVEKFLGDSVVHISVINMLICTKLLLHRHYSNPKTLLQNCIGYLTSFHTRRHLFLEVCLRLLRVWGDSSSLKHTSAEQHLYISKALMMCIGSLNEAEKQSCKDKMLMMLMPGVQAHLESSDPATRMVGMTVAKALTETVDPSGPKLEFEVDLTNPLVSELLSFRDELPEDPGPSPEEVSLMAPDDSVTKGIDTVKLEEKAREMEQADLDSDDDLEPYDMSQDTKLLKAKPPKYVRDCMEGLISSSEDPDRTEMCLQHAESLIRKKPFGLSEIAAEFAKILLHLQDTHCFENYLTNRLRALVALTITCPSQVADYLTSQFYERNYSIRQRMDILEVLAAAAQELSQPQKDEPANEKNMKSCTELSPTPDAVSWREIVQRRIESNTRRFARGRSKPEPIPKPNRLVAVAGQFFYPLMTKVDKSEPCIDLLERDTTLLFRLLYTLAIVLYSSMNIPTAYHMGRTLLGFTWPVRLHPDSSVRQAVLIATSSIFLVVPAHNLLGDLHSDVTETKFWLEDVIEQDPDTECQKLAAQALLLLEDQIKKEIQSSKS
ncbi:hypothetical protein BsWGS_06751 [Bradybaena similaris]